MTRAMLGSAAIGLMLATGCATSATDEDLGSPIDSSPPKDSSLDATPGMDSASNDSAINDSAINDGDITDASDSSIDDSDADAGCLDGGLCFAGFLCCNKVSSVNYGKCESIACAGCCK